MLRSLFIFITLIITCGFIVNDNYNDPTGTYILEGKKGKDGETYGYFGEVLVKKLKTDKILVAFEICKGAPSYNSGSFLDTLDFDGTSAVYEDLEIDSTCQIKFLFTQEGVTAKETTADYNFGCGFGHAVIADGFFKKTSSKEPDFKSSDQ